MLTPVAIMGMTVMMGRHLVGKNSMGYGVTITRTAPAKTKEREIVEKSYKDKYRELLAEWNEFVSFR